MHHYGSVIHLVNGLFSIVSFLQTSLVLFYVTFLNDDLHFCFDARKTSNKYDCP